MAETKKAAAPVKKAVTKDEKKETKAPAGVYESVVEAINKALARK